MGKLLEKTFFQSHVSSQQEHDKIFYITNNQGNAYQNHTEISPHTH